jgi:hypothetical protein
MMHYGHMNAFRQGRALGDIAVNWYIYINVYVYILTYMKYFSTNRYEWIPLCT